jgi:uncharacterized lipoprotein YmbA
VPAALLLAMAAGCVNLGPARDPSRYFHLPPPAARPAASPATLSVGLGEVSLPGYLEGSHIVRRIGGSEVRPARSDYWAEPLADQVRGAVRDGLAAGLGAPRIVLYPWREDQAPAYRLDLRVVRFEPDTLGQVELEADWVVSQVESGEVVRHGRGTWRDQAPAPGTAEQVAAMSRALQQMTAEIAGQVRQIGN